jgi:23S rRNA (cytidine2498-2'-O)-methyltransferase
MTQISDQIHKSDASNVASFILTSNHGFAQYAQEEIKRLFSHVRFNILVPTEIILFELDWPRESALDMIKSNEPVFVRHLQPVDQRWSLISEEKDEQVMLYLQTWIHALPPFKLNERVAIHIRMQDKYSMPLTALEIKQVCESWLNDSHQVISVQQQANWIISIYISSTHMYVCCAEPSDLLSDWPGGAIRFKKQDDLISRATFKLLEAESVFSINFNLFSQALDIGAAPGGWTSFLLDRGLHVTAIDPARLHESLMVHPRLTYYSKKIAEMKFENHIFDLIVCDMSFSPKHTVNDLITVIHTLKKGGRLLMTVKLMHKKPFQTIRNVVQSLEAQLQMIKAKQLFHNREEFTILFIKK